jgi:hypothetical protein
MAQSEGSSLIYAAGQAVALFVCFWDCVEDEFA